jgi:hypothetical protein
VDLVLSYLVLVAIVSWLATPSVLNARDVIRAGRGARHRNPGLPSMRQRGQALAVHRLVEPTPVPASPVLTPSCGVPTRSITLTDLMVA